MLIILILIIVLFFILSAFFSGMETGLISIDKLRFEQQAKKDKTKHKILQFLTNPDKLFGTTLFGNNISLVVVSSLIIYIYNLYKAKTNLSEHAVTLITAALILVFGELIPKALFRDFPNKLVTKGFPYINFFRIIFSPFVKFVSLLNTLLSKFLKLKKKSGFNLITREDLSYLLSETTDENSDQVNQKQMLEEVLEFNELDAENVMLHRTEIVAFAEDTTIAEVIKTASEKGFTRFPVYKENLDNIVGILIIYDLLKAESNHDKTAKDFVRKAHFTPENTDVNALLKEMQTNKKSMVIVVDSFGGTAGLITIEDIVEEIVGEIEDEYDTSTYKIEKINKNNFIVQGFVEVDLLNDNYNMELPEGDYETIAGLIIDKFERIPREGTQLELSHWNIKVLQVTKTKILKVQLMKIIK